MTKTRTICLSVSLMPIPAPSSLPEVAYVFPNKSSLPPPFLFGMKCHNLQPTKLCRPFTSPINTYFIIFYSSFIHPLPYPILPSHSLPTTGWMSRMVSVTETFRCHYFSSCVFQTWRPLRMIKNV